MTKTATSSWFPFQSRIPGFVLKPCSATTSTMNTVLVAIAVCGFVCLPCIKGQLVINVKKGNVTGDSTGVEWVHPLRSGGRSLPCARHGVVKLTFVPGERERAVITLTFHTDGPKEFTFNLGDSNTNNMFGEDFNTQDNDAEIHSYRNAIYFWGRQPGPGKHPVELLFDPDFVGATSSLSIEVKDQQVKVDNGNRTLELSNPDLFQLKGQPDTNGVNYDLYLGINRAIYEYYRRGSGVCEVTIQFFPS